MIRIVMESTHPMPLDRENVVVSVRLEGHEGVLSITWGGRAHSHRAKPLRILRAFEELTGQRLTEEDVIDMHARGDVVAASASMERVRSIVEVSRG